MSAHPASVGVWKTNLKLGGMRLFRELLADADHPITHGGIDGDRAHVLWMTQNVYLTCTPLGAHCVDVLIRTHACLIKQPPFPMPSQVVGEVLLALVNHRLPSPIFCMICGLTSHSATQCDQRDTFVASKPAKKKKNKAIPRNGTNSIQLCQSFMRKPHGVCTRKPCVYRHECTFCGAKRKHLKSCGRP